MDTNATKTKSLVAPADEMDDETFCKHFNMRHKRNLHGLSHIWALSRVIQSWRSFHKRLHALCPSDFDHEHAT